MVEAVVKDFLTKTLQLTEDSLVQHALNIFEIRHLKKGEIFFWEGRIPDCIALVWNGILRGFLIDKEGNDHTDCFRWERGGPVVPSIPMDAPAIVNMEAIEESDIICFPISQMVDKMNDPALMRVYNKFLQAAMKEQIELKDMLQQSAMQRYQWFLRRYPGLDERVSGKYIASFLHITPVTLSRLRRSLREGGASVSGT